MDEVQNEHVCQEGGVVCEWHELDAQKKRGRRGVVNDIYILIDIFLLKLPGCAPLAFPGVPLRHRLCALLLAERYSFSLFLASLY